MQLDGGRCYLDANAFIYYGESHPIFGAPVRAVLERSLAQTLIVVTSELTLAEVLVLPLKLGNELAVAGYEQLLRNRAGFELIPVSRAILMDSARLRASSGYKMPDAIHIATAQAVKCDVLLSEDHRLRSSGGLQIIRISDLTSTQDHE